jgi:lipid A 3-O-deacylase
VIKKGYVDGSIFLFVFVFIFAFSSISSGEEPSDYISISTAIFDVLQNDIPSTEGRIEYRVNSAEWLLKPFTGFMANTDGARYIYAGLFFEISITDFFSLIPSFAPGFYIKNFSKDLHSILEFRSQIEAIVFLSGKLRAGFSFSHISNASLGESNPGVESVGFTVQLPVP